MNDWVLEELSLIVGDLETSNKKMALRVERVLFTLTGYKMAMDSINGGCDCHGED